MSRLSCLLAALVLIVLVSSGAAEAATVTERPDLLERLSRLRLIYPPLCPNTKLDPGFPCANGSDDMQAGGKAYSTDRFKVVVGVSGEIEPGDANEIRALLEARSSAAVVIIVFDSPGGNFAEALRLGELFNERQRLSEEATPMLLTYVLAGDVCYSACALAFALNGNADAWDPGRRFIEDGGRIGFHMPYMPEDLAAKETTFADAMVITYDAVAGITQLVVGRANPPSLLAKIMAERKPDHLFELSATIEAWRYGFVPVAEGGRARIVAGSGLDANTVRSVCEALATTQIHFGGEGSAPYLPWDEPDEALPTLHDQFGGATSLRLLFPGDIWHCAVSVEDNVFSAGVLPGEPDCEGTLEEDLVGLGRWCRSRWNPATDGSDGKHALEYPVTIGFLADAFGCRPNNRLAAYGEYRTEDEPIETTTLRVANLRSAPSTGAGNIAELAPRTAVSIRGCRITGDSQGIWYEVSTDRGPGWISARLVSAPTNPLVFDTEDY